MKVLNLYAGIGGNRKLWENVEVTAVELNPEIASIYKKHFPHDNVIVADAHQYLLEHYKEFDFIWSSPPCPTHSQLCMINKVRGSITKYPDMKLYEEILMLTYYFEGKWCVENVMSYYDPLIKPQCINNHYFWANFIILKIKENLRCIAPKAGEGQEFFEYRERLMGFDMDCLGLKNDLRVKVIKNCVEPETGKHILKCAITEPQRTLVMEAN